MSLLQALAEVLLRRGRSGWLVGGTVRDRLLGRPSPDLDVVVADDPALVARAVAGLLGRPCFPLSHEFGAYRVVGDAAHLDVVALRGGSLEADLALRDFTVNAMAATIDGAEVVDPFGGRRDLEARRLRVVGPGVFGDDPLRLLRAVRLAHTLGLALDDGSVELARAEAWRLSQAAPERVLAELASAFLVTGAARVICLLSRLRLLPHLFPEVAALRGVPSGEDLAVPGSDSYGHTLATLRALDRLLDAPADLLGPVWTTLAPRLERPVDGVMGRPAALRLAALLLEIGRPAARGPAVGGGEAFWGHATLGARLAGDVADRLRGSRALRGLLVTAVAEHACLVDLASPAEPVARRRLVLTLWHAAPWESEVLLLAWAANEAEAHEEAVRGRGRSQTADAACPSGAELVARRRQFGRALLLLWAERATRGVSLPPVDGHDLMAALDVPPGPRLGELLRELTLAWEAGELGGRDEAWVYVRSLAER